MNKDELNKEMWNKVAHLYQNQFMYLDLYNDTYDLFCKLVQQKDAQILEIGCGPGNISRYLLNARPDFHLLCTDIAPAMVELAAQNIPEVRFKVLDCREISLLKETFDGIVCGFCLPYLCKEDTEKLIDDCAQLLNKGGILYFSTIEGVYTKSDFEYSSDRSTKMFVYLHEETYLTEMLMKNNFTQISTHRKNYTKRDGSTSTHLIFVAEKKNSVSI